ncbi:MAG TPA: hypothetical protein PLJ47_01205 [Candidatus Hydrogenedentes bacterium]|nr:hypothetical protein [Candidatus Hydrogenedentota bacterium]
MGDDVKSKRRLPLRELFVILLLFVVATMLVLPVLRTTRTAVLDRTCAGNLKQWSQIFSQYRSENDRLNPTPHGFEPYGAASNASGCSNIDDAFDFAPSVPLIFPDYATDFTLLACPDAPGILPPVMLGPAVLRPPRLDPGVFGIAQGSCDATGSITRPGASYTYLGFEQIYSNDRDLQISQEMARQAGLPASGPAGVVALLKRLQVTRSDSYDMIQGVSGQAFIVSQILEALGPAHAEELKYMMLPLSEQANNPALVVEVGVDRSDEVARYPILAVMWDAIRQDSSGNPIFHHNEPAGCNVLFMDGHVEFKPYPGDFPVSRGFATMQAVR